MNVAIDSSRGAVVAAPLDRAREPLRDLEAILRLFPNLRALRPEGDGVWFTELEPLGTAGISHVVTYTSRYVVDVERGLVEWSPAPGRDNASISGRCALTAEGAGTRLAFRARGELRDIAVPLLARPVAGPFIKATFDRMIERYVERLVGLVKGG